MQALIVRDGRLEYTTSWPEPKPAGGEVLIAVRLAGICATDLEIIRGYLDFQGVLGHEFVGTVIKGPKKLQNRRVVAEINCVCGRCDLCQSGLSMHCRNRQVVGIQQHDGVFAEYVVVPERNVHLVPDSLSDDEAVFVEPLAAAFQIIQQVPIDSRDKVIVLGDGRLGLLVVQVLADVAGRGNVSILGKHEEKLTFAEKRGIQTMLLDDMLLKPQWDVVVDCTGSARGFETACKLIRPRGKLVLKSTWVPDPGTPVDLSALVINEIALVGSRCGPFPTALSALQARKIVTHGLITSRFDLSEGIQALETARQSNQLKVVLDIQSGH